MRRSGYACSLAILLASTAVVALSSGPAMAERWTCRVAHVDRAGPTTVRLYVPEANEARVQLIHAGRRQRFDIQPPGYGFTAQLGDQIVAPQCLMTVTMRGGRIGVELSGPGHRITNGSGPSGEWEASDFRDSGEGFVPAR